MSYVYIQSESAAETAGGWPLWTVGAYGPEGQWHPDSDYGGEKGRDEAAARVSFLNGDHVPDPRALAGIVARVDALEVHVVRLASAIELLNKRS
jgi:hypothetical protein